jgi:hypothetical protein
MHRSNMLRLTAVETQKSAIVVLFVSPERWDFCHSFVTVAQELAHSSIPIGGLVPGSDLESVEQLESGRSAAW